MPQECTATAIIWPGMAERRAARYELWENFRPVWRSACPCRPMTLVSAPGYPLATLIALHLAYAGQLDLVPGLQWPAAVCSPLGLTGSQASRLYRALEGRAVSIVRFPRCYIRDAELARLSDAGIRADLVESSWEPARGRWP